jgi:hypothetical protein
MSEIIKLLAKKDNLLIQLACLVNDINEYINYPVETVSVQDMHYQYDFIVSEIGLINRKIYFEFNRQTMFFRSQHLDLKKLTEKATSTIVFTVKDLPKSHYSLWENSK